MMVDNLWTVGWEWKTESLKAKLTYASKIEKNVSNEEIII